MGVLSPARNAPRRRARTTRRRRRRSGLCAAYMSAMRPPQQKPVMPSLLVSAFSDFANATAASRSAITCASGVLLTTSLISACVSVYFARVALRARTAPARSRSSRASRAVARRRECARARPTPRTRRGSRERSCARPASRDRPTIMPSFVGTLTSPAVRPSAGVVIVCADTGSTAAAKPADSDVTMNVRRSTARGSPIEAAQLGIR